MYTQLVKLKQVGHKLRALSKYLEQNGSSTLHEQIQETEYSSIDFCAKKPASLWKVTAR